MKQLELRDFGYAPGKYWCKCQHCSLLFDGDKRASNCEDCAEKLMTAYVLKFAKDQCNRVIAEQVRDRIISRLGGVANLTSVIETELLDLLERLEIDNLGKGE